MNALDELTESFSHLPGIGKKSAARIANSLLKADGYFMARFAEQIKTLQEKIKPCSVCGAWTEDDPCPICSDVTRDRSIICVVEQPQDVSTIESYGEYKGTYHVLGGLIKPLEGIGPSQLSFTSLINRLKKDDISEIIIATNPTVEGDTTALYLNKIILEAELPSPPKVTRLATGIPVGGDLEYIDKRTLSLSFRGRSQM